MTELVNITPTSGERGHGEPVPGAAVQGEAAQQSAMDFRLNNNSGALIIIIDSQVGELSAGAACNSVPSGMRNSAPAKAAAFMPSHAPPKYSKAKVDAGENSGTVIVLQGACVPHVVIPSVW